MNADFAHMLSQIRKESGLSQKQAAKELGISQALLSHYEKGVREPKFEFVIRACDFYGVSADYLLGRASEKNHRLSNDRAQRCCESTRAAMAFAELSEGLTEAVAGYLSIGVEKAVKILRAPEEGVSPVDDAVMKLAEARLIKAAFDAKSRFIFSEENLQTALPGAYAAYRETSAEVALLRAELLNRDAQSSAPQKP
ncbi:MAG: helix-turn-helix transcriptional regulator [Oscillospiraceae bacterium]|nr:helix-turn-helix transcriptional regulator [Oscillospiraceae bacterium]